MSQGYVFRVDYDEAREYVRLTAIQRGGMEFSLAMEGTADAETMLRGLKTWIADMERHMKP